MKIYFAGSIKGGRGNQETYALIVNILKKHGTVLTEHVADKRLTNQGEITETVADEFIFGRDVTWLRDSDVLVAEVTTPSLGVGYEIGLAESIKKPIVCLFRKIDGRSVSAMISGNKAIKIYTYNNLEELLGILDGYFSNLSN